MFVMSHKVQGIYFKALGEEYSLYNIDPYNGELKENLYRVCVDLWYCYCSWLHFNLHC